MIHAAPIHITPSFLKRNSRIYKSSTLFCSHERAQQEQAHRGSLPSHAQSGCPWQYTLKGTPATGREIQPDGEWASHPGSIPGRGATQQRCSGAVEEGGMLFRPTVRDAVPDENHFHGAGDGLLAISVQMEGNGGLSPQRRRRQGGRSNGNPPPGYSPTRSAMRSHILMVAALQLSQKVRPLSRWGAR